MKLTPHFQIAEFKSRDGASTPRGYTYWVVRLCRDYLEPLRAEFGPVTIISGNRSAKHNASVGGARESLHLRIDGRRGAAADVTCKKGTPDDWYRFLDGLGAPGLGKYKTHVHVDNLRGRARW